MKKHVYELLNFSEKKIYRYHNINVASIAHHFNIDYSTCTLEVWHNEDSPIYGVRWSIGTVKFEEFHIIITILKFEQILRSLTHPSRSRNIHTSYGNKLFALDRCLGIWKMHFFLVWLHSVSARDHFKTNLG
jgi:hypothetical protein